jgi:glycosyltransferase involved in cell wall biosynthesis
MALRVLHYVDENSLSWAEPWLQLLEELKRLGVENVVLCRPGGTLGDKAESRGFPVRRYRPPFPWAPALCRGVPSVLKAVKPDLIHTRLSTAAALGGYWGQKLGIPVLSTIDKYPKGKYYRWSSHIVGCSTAVSEHMKGLGFPSCKVSTIHNPIKVERYARDVEARKSLRASAGVGEDELIFLGCGRFVGWKAFDVLLLAYDRLSALRPHRLWIAGSGAMEQEWQALSRSLSSHDRVSFFGFVEDIRPLLWAADVFVQPSKEPEGFSLMLLEAAAAGLPLIATAIGGTLDIADDRCGWLVPPDDADALARAMSMALNEDLTEKALLAADKARQFDVSVIARRYADEYERVMSDE